MNFRFPMGCSVAGLPTQHPVEHCKMAKQNITDECPNICPRSTLLLARSEATKAITLLAGIWCWRSRGGGDGGGRAEQIKWKDRPGKTNIWRGKVAPSQSKSHLPASLDSTSSTHFSIVGAAVQTVRRAGIRELGNIIFAKGEPGME